VRPHVLRQLGLTTAALLLVTGGEASLATPLDPGHGARQVDYTSTVAIVGGDAGCDPTDPARCAGTFRSVRTMTGDLSGTAYVAGSAVLLADGTYQGQAVAQFTGEVAGCGTGTLVMIETGVLDPATGGSPGTWRIVAGQGSGDLLDTSGDGTADAIGQATGRVRCR
jgi:hypothetical protein